MHTQSTILQTKKSARVYTYGQLTKDTKLIWIVAHGYGQLAAYTLKKFEVLNPCEHFVIVPEALSRFYLDGLAGRVGASWMTTEDREYEIADYISYLEKVYETFVLHSDAKVVAFGFSQGASTICRWALQTQKRLNNIVLWGGSIPNECLEQVDQLNKLAPYLLVGDTDIYISEERKEEIMKNLRNIGLTFSHIFYKGGHSIVTEPLIELSTRLTQT